MRKSSVTLLVLVLAAGAPALAQVDWEESEGVRVFLPAYYLEYDPVAALQMVFRTPGFNPQEQEGGRGLSGVRSNVLINGERPPPKGKSVREQLRELPVTAVERIELIDAGARQDIDMQGYPQVVNVITVANIPAYYEVTTQILRAGTGEVDQENQRNTEVQANGSFSWKAHEFTMRGDMRDRNNQSPADFVSIDPANPVQRISSVNQSDQKNQGIQLGADFELPSDSSLNFTSQFNSFTLGSAPLSLDQTAAAVIQSFDNENDQQDLSTEYRRPFGEQGTLMVALVDTRQEQQSASSLRTDTVNRSSITNRESGETAARILISRTLTERLTLRTTATNAFNFFEGGFRLFENDIESTVAGSDSRVEEDRRSLDASVDWNISDRLTMRSTVGLESYEIRSRDSSSGLRTDPKGEFSISYRPKPRTTWSLESQREIGQLSFNQFLASSSLSSEIVSAGAISLEPERKWTHAAKYDQRFGDAGVMRFQLSRETIDNPVGTVALSDSITVAQNVSPATIDRIQASIEFPFEAFGREDLVLSAQGQVSQSDTIDPITGEQREVSGIRNHYWSFEFRRDPGDSKLAWGVSLQRASDGTSYSVRRTGNSTSNGEWGAYVEWEPIDGLKFRTNLDGPRTTTESLNFFAAVRQPGLDPSFIASTTTRMDRAASFQVEWRRMQHFEIRANINTRPRIRLTESLLPFGDTMGSMLAAEFATTPRVNLRVRYFK